jgi:hypothetical protein
LKRGLREDDRVRDRLERRGLDLECVNLPVLFRGKKKPTVLRGLVFMSGRLSRTLHTGSAVQSVQFDGGIAARRNAATRSQIVYGAAAEADGLGDISEGVTDLAKIANA